MDEKDKKKTKMKIEYEWDGKLSFETKSKSFDLIEMIDSVLCTRCYVVSRWENCKIK